MPVSDPHKSAGPSRQLASDVAKEAFLFLRRIDLEACELVCTLWGTAVIKNVSTLPLRYVDFFWVSARQKRLEMDRHEWVLCDAVEFMVRSGNQHVDCPAEGKLLAQYEYDMFSRLRNAYVERLTFSSRIFLFDLLQYIRRYCGEVGSLALDEPELSVPDLVEFVRLFADIAKWQSLFLKMTGFDCKDLEKLTRANPCTSVAVEVGGEFSGSDDYLWEIITSVRCKQLSIKCFKCDLYLLGLMQRARFDSSNNTPDNVRIQMRYCQLDSGDLLACKAISRTLQPLRSGADEVRYRLVHSTNVEHRMLEMDVVFNRNSFDGPTAVHYRLVPRTVRSLYERTAKSPSLLVADVLDQAFCFLPRADVDTTQLVCRRWNVFVERRGSVLPLHHLQQMTLGIAHASHWESRASWKFRIQFTYHAQKSAHIVDSRMFKRLVLDHVNADRIRLPFAHLRNAYVDQIVLPKEKGVSIIFRRFLPKEWGLTAGSVLNKDQLEIVDLMTSIDVGVFTSVTAVDYLAGAAPVGIIQQASMRFPVDLEFVLSLIERFEKLMDSSRVVDSFSHKASAFTLAKLLYELAHQYELVRDASPLEVPELEGQEYAVHLVHVPVGAMPNVLQVQLVCQNELVVMVKTRFL